MYNLDRYMSTNGEWKNKINLHREWCESVERELNDSCLISEESETK